MARPALLPPSAEPSDLRATKGALDQRWIELNRLIASALDLDASGRQLRVDADYQADGVWAGLQGAACERISRNHGGATWVAPLCILPAELVAWLGWQEVWEVTTGPRPFRFRNIGLTVYIGRPNEAIKPQLLRLEWPGIRNWSGAGLCFQSPGAGHPHWQIDLLQSLANPDESVVFVPERGEIVEDFGAAIPTPRVNDLLRSLSIERMHLASAAPWWLAPASSEATHHMNAPPDIAALSRWLIQSIRYLRQELKRCTLRN